MPPVRELDKKTFSDPRVKAALEKRALFKADMTKTGSPETLALAQKYAILGVPTLIFLDASGQERADMRLVGFEDADAFLKRDEALSQKAQGRSQSGRGAARAQRLPLLLLLPLQPGSRPRRLGLPSPLCAAPRA